MYYKMHNYNYLIGFYMYVAVLYQLHQVQKDN